MADQASGIRDRIRAREASKTVSQYDRRTGEAPTATNNGSSPFRKLAKWTAITIGGLIALVITLGIVGAATATPEQKARWAAERAERDKEKALRAAAQEAEENARLAQERAARNQQQSDVELKAKAAEYGLRYESDWGKSYQITAAEMGDRWPFIHDTATVFCKMTDYGRPMVTISFDGGSTLYGLNGVARGKEKLRGTDDVQRRHPEWGTFTGDVSSLINRAITNCG